jgi:hypothetical protein
MFAIRERGMMEGWAGIVRTSVGGALRLDDATELA